MTGSDSTMGPKTDGLRERNKPVRAGSVDEARRVVIELNAVEDRKDDNDKHKRTFGRTPDGVGQCDS